MDSEYPKDDDAESLADLTEALNMDDDDNAWEDAFAVEEDGLSARPKLAALVGKALVPKIGSVKLLNSIFQRLWWDVKGWKMKLLTGENGVMFVGLEFSSLDACNRVLEKGPWCFNGGVLFLKPWPDSEVIDENQSAFVAGRQINDNILLGFECNH